jgi:glutathione S-transferase
VRSDVGALRDERSSEHVFFPPGSVPPPGPLSVAGQRAAEKVVRIASALVPDGGGALFGAWSIADTDLAMMLWRLSKTGYALPAKVRAFADAEWERPAVREFAAMPRPAKFVAY